MTANRALASVAVALGISLTAVSAFAVQPLKEPFFYGPIVRPVWDPVGNPVMCGEATVLTAWVLYGTQTTYYDSTGQVVRIKIHGRIDETWALDTGAGNQLRARANYNTFTLEPGLEKWTGLFWHVIAPGVGTVFLDAGFEIVDWATLPPTLRAVHGKHQWLDGDFDAVCAALQ